jgi:hypothetical protein
MPVLSDLETEVKLAGNSVIMPATAEQIEASACLMMPPVVYGANYTDNIHAPMDPARSIMIYRSSAYEQSRALNYNAYVDVRPPVQPPHAWMSFNAGSYSGVPTGPSGCQGGYSGREGSRQYNAYSYHTTPTRLNAERVMKKLNEERERERERGRRLRET